MHVRFSCVPELRSVLPEPYPARRGLPDWLKEMATHAYSETLADEVRTIKKCPPFLDAMSHGFLIPLPCDIHVADGAFEWNWEAVSPDLPAHTPHTPLGFHDSAQAVGSPFFAADTVILKFFNFWTIELDPGFSLLATHPINRTDLPFRAVTGLVSADLYKDNYIHFPVEWVDAGFTGVLPRGTPVVQCIPIRRDDIELSVETMDAAGIDRLEATLAELSEGPGAYRRKFRAR